jgi:hypothetical protein
MKLARSAGLPLTHTLNQHAHQFNCFAKSRVGRRRDSARAWKRVPGTVDGGGAGDPRRSVVG